MEIFGPVGVVSRQTAGKVLDIVVLAVPVATAGKKFVDGIVLWYVRTLDVGTHVAHPTLPTFLHLLHDDALQLPVCQRLPRLEAQVVGSEFRHLLHCVIAHLITAQEKFLDTAHDALLLVHLRDGLAFVVLLIRIAEGLADEVDAKRLEHAVP